MVVSRGLWGIWNDPLRGEVGGIFCINRLLIFFPSFSTRLPSVPLDRPADCGGVSFRPWSFLVVEFRGAE